MNALKNISLLALALTIAACGSTSTTTPTYSKPDVKGMTLDFAVVDAVDPAVNVAGLAKDDKVNIAFDKDTEGAFTLTITSGEAKVAIPVTGATVSDRDAKGMKATFSFTSTELAALSSVDVKQADLDAQVKLINFASNGKDAKDEAALSGDALTKAQAAAKVFTDAKFSFTVEFSDADLTKGGKITFAGQNAEAKFDAKADPVKMVASTLAAVDFTATK